MFSIIIKLLDLLSTKEKRNLYFLSITVLGVAFVEIAGIASILPFMSVVSDPSVIENNKWFQSAYNLLNQFIIAYNFPILFNLQSFLFFLGLLVLGLLVFSNLFKAITLWWRLRYENYIYYILARRLLAAYLARPYVFFLNRNTTEMSKNVLAEARNVTIFLGAVIDLFSSIVVSTFILGLLIAINPWIAMTIAAVVGGSYSVIYIATRRRLSSIGQESFEANTMKFKVAGEALSGIKDVKILGSEKVFLERFAHYALRQAQKTAVSSIITQLPRFALETIAFGGILMILLHFLGSEQDVTQIVPLLALYAFSGYRLLPAIQQIFANISCVRLYLPSLETLHRDFNEGHALHGADIKLVGTENLKRLPFTHELVLSNVAFRYPGSQRTAIQDINLTIPLNTSVGLVGTTGSGKTTLVDVILGLLVPTSGQVLVDGNAIYNSNLAGWQRNLGYVPQHIYLCDDTITKNIAFGVPEQQIDMTSVIRAAQIANIHEFIEGELPDSYETIVGERGVRLSGGQRQRIGIARALYRNPTLLVMDEATSALDSITEEIVMEALRTLSGKKTIFIIAHRLTTVKDCDVIYLMKHGHIVNRGTYDDLLLSSTWFQAAARLRV